MATARWDHVVDGAPVAAGDLAAAATAARAGSGFLWVRLSDPSPTDLAPVADALALHPLVVEDLLATDHRPKIDHDDVQVLAVVRLLSLVGTDHPGSTRVHRTGTVSVHVTAWSVLTVLHGAHDESPAEVNRLTGRTDSVPGNPAVVLHRVLDAVADGAVRIAQDLDDVLDQLETEVLADTRRNDAELVYRVRRAELEVRRALDPLVPTLRVLSRKDLPVLPVDVRGYLLDVSDQLDRAHDLVLAQQEIATSIVGVNLAQLSVSQNDDMRRITAWAAIIAIPTALAGIWGMNFDHMPELGWTWGYPLALGLMALTCVLLYRGFRRNGWL